MKWTPAQEQELKCLAPQGLGIGDIAAALTKKFKQGFSYGSVDHKARRLGIAITPGGASSSPPPKKHTRKSLDYEGAIAALKDKLGLVGKENKALKKRVGELHEIRRVINATCQPMEPQQIQYTKVLVKKPKHEYSAVAMVSDWHTAEVIDSKAMAGWGEYNLEIQECRVKAYGQKVLHWLETQRSGLYIPRLRVLVLGDMVSGDIHHGLSVTNQVPTPEAACLAGKMLAELVAGWAPHAEISVDIIGLGNHDRLTLKPQFKKGAMNSWNVVVYWVASALLKDHPKVTVCFHEDSPAELDFDGLNVLAMHGHQVRGWMGIPNYGMQRLRGRLALGYMYHGKAFKTCICGHWHEGQEPAGWIVGGCLGGTSELDRNMGRFAPPSQTSFLWHSRHGEFNLTRWNLEGE